VQHAAAGAQSGEEQAGAPFTIFGTGSMAVQFCK
jgi:hypothetical protein